MSGPKGVITVTSHFKHALADEQEGYEQAVALAGSAQLEEIRKSQVLASTLDSKSSTSMSFEPANNCKEIVLDHAYPIKMARIETTLSDK